MVHCRRVARELAEQLGFDPARTRRASPRPSRRWRATRTCTRARAWRSCECAPGAARDALGARERPGAGHRAAGGHPRGALRPAAGLGPGLLALAPRLMDRFSVRSDGSGRSGGAGRSCCRHGRPAPDPGGAGALPRRAGAAARAQGALDELQRAERRSWCAALGGAGATGRGSWTGSTASWRRRTAAWWRSTRSWTRRPRRCGAPSELQDALPLAT